MKSLYYCTFAGVVLRGAAIVVTSCERKAEKLLFAEICKKLPALHDINLHPKAMTITKHCDVPTVVADSTKIYNDGDY